MKAFLLLMLCGCFSLPVLAGATDEFVTIWQTNNSGQSNPNEIRFYGEGNGYTLIWEEVGNPANTGTLTAGLITPANYQLITFPAAGTYKVRVDPAGVGTFTNFNPDGDEQKLIEVAQWGTTQWTNLAGAFSDCHNLDVTAQDAPNLSNITSLAQTFSFCYGLIGTPAFNTWQMGTITDMNGMFWSAAQFNQDLNNWNTSNVTNMFNMFENADQFNANISTWNTSQVTNMGSMFKSADNFNQPLGSWNTGAVTNMAAMFDNAAVFNQPVGSWNVSAVNSMESMFKNASAFNQSIATWNTAAVTNMNSMFENATAFNQPIGSWNVGAVASMQGMFKSASAFNQSIANWTTTAVTNMSAMFESASAFDQPIGGWNVAAVTNMNAMFYYAVNFNQPLNNWNVSSVTNMNDMFFNATSFNQPLNGWNTSGLIEAINLFRSASQFNQPLSNWNMSSVTQIMGMFEDASGFNQDISSWDLSSINPGAYGFLNNSGMDCMNYSLLLNSLADNPAMASNITLGAVNRIYDSTASVAHDYLINTKGWILDGDSYVADCNTALPLSLHDFTAQYQEPFAVLGWQGGDEADVDFYEVEQAVDGVHFRAVQQLAKQPGVDVYAYNHLQQEALAYYRIKAVRYSGQVGYSETRSLRTIASGNNPLVMLYPNPADGATLQLKVSQIMEVELFDQLGKSLGKHQLEPGNNVLDITALPAGLYWVRYSEGSQKFIIKR